MEKNKLRMASLFDIRLLQVRVQLAKRPVSRIRDVAVHEFGQPRVADARTFGDFLPFAPALNQLRN